MAPRDAHKTDWSDASVALTITVLGCTGDLAKKKTYPALFALYLHKHLPRGTVVVGYARSDLDDDGLRDRVRSYLKGPPETVEAFLAACHYERGAYEDAGRTGVFAGLGARVAAFERQRSASVGHRIFYLALPPSVYPPVCANIKEGCMSVSGWTQSSWRNPSVETFAPARKLSSGISELFSEAQLYRIDHYLGKELTQNLVVMRFANRFLAPLWNRDNISNVQIIFKGPSAPRAAAATSISTASSATSSRTTSFSFSASSPWRNHVRSPRTTSATRSSRCCVHRARLHGWCRPRTVHQRTRRTGVPDDPTVPAGRAPTFAMTVLEVNNERWRGCRSSSRRVRH